jgi:hypothetical protein
MLCVRCSPVVTETIPIPPLVLVGRLAPRTAILKLDTNLATEGILFQVFALVRV